VAVWGIPEINKEFQKAPEIFITPDKANQLSPYSLIPGDIAMSRKGNVGQCAIYPESFEPGIIASDVLRIRIDKTKLVPLFMQYQLHHSERVKNQVLQVSNGAVMAGINVTKLKGIVIYIPPIRLQKKFADFVQQTDKSKFEIKKAIENTSALIKSLMQQDLTN
jgi:type I restriction enzyme S subunit